MSLHKNITAACVEICRSHFRDASAEGEKPGLYYASMALDYMIQTSPSPVEKFDELLREIGSARLELGARLNILDKLREKCHKSSHWASRIFLKTAEILLNAGVILLEEDRDFIGAKLKFHEAEPLISCALSCSESIVDLVRELVDLEGRLKQQKAIALSRLHLRRGDGFFIQALEEGDELDMESIYKALDEYKMAQLEAARLDVECEAIAAAKLGKAWFRVLKDRERAKTYCAHAIRMGMTLQPRDLSPTEWWQETQAILNEIQQQIARDAEAEKERIQGPIMDKLRPRLNKLRAAADQSVEALLELLKAEFMPPGDMASSGLSNLSGTGAADTSDENRKRRLRKAVAVFHPDRWTTADVETKVLHEEICKILNGIWSNMKSAD